MRHALELGVNWIDTAAVYGLGHSEEVVGRLLRDLPGGERPFVFTKCGLVWDERDRMAAPRRPRGRSRSGASARPRSAGSASSASTSTSSTGPTQTGTPVEDSWGAMVRLVEEGQGPRDRRLELRRRAARALRGGPPRDSLQPPFSLIRREAAAAEIPWCADARHRRHLLQPDAVGPPDRHVHAPSASQRLPTDDWRRRVADFQPPQLERNLALRDALQPIAARHGTTVAAVAIAWALAWPGVTGAIVGARSPDRSTAGSARPRLTLTDADLDEIAAALERTGAGRGSGPGVGRVGVRFWRRSCYSAMGLLQLSWFPSMLRRKVWR